MFLGETLDSHSASLRTGVKLGTGNLSRQPDRMLGSNLGWTSIPSGGQ